MFDLGDLEVIDKGLASLAARQGPLSVYGAASESPVSTGLTCARPMPAPEATCPFAEQSREGGLDG